MASTAGFSPKIQDANRQVATARPQMDTRLQNAGKIETASKYLELNVPFFEKHSEGILKLIKDTGNLSSAVNTLNEAGYNAGPCKITVKGRIWDSKIKKPIEEVNEEVQNLLDTEVVKTALTTLGIAEKAPAPYFTLPESPSNGTLVKGGAIAGAVAIGSGIYFRKEIVAATPPRVLDAASFIYSYVPAVPQVVRNAASSAYSYVPGVPQTVKDIFSKVPSMPSTKDVTEFFSNQWSTIANSPAGVFVANNKIAVGAIVGAIVAVGVIYAICRAVQNRTNEKA